MPAGLKAVGDAGGHDRSDVAVGAADPGYALSEPPGLSDLGDVVLDWPGLVGVLRVVEMYAFQERPGAGGGVALDGRAARPGGKWRSGAARPRAPQNTVSWSRPSITSLRRSMRDGEVDVADGGGLGGPR